MSLITTLHFKVGTNKSLVRACKNLNDNSSFLGVHMVIGDYYASPSFLSFIPFSVYEELSAFPQMIIQMAYLVRFTLSAPSALFTPLIRSSP